MKSFQEFINESNQGVMLRRFIKNNSPVGTITDVRVNGNIYTIQWKMVEHPDQAKLKKVEAWIKNNVEVEDIELSFNNIKGTATLFFIADNLPASMQSKTV
jgi:hypothetical protein